MAQQTRTTPIIVASLPRPGGNVTGFTAIEGSLGGKWVELLKEIAPEVARVVLLFTTPVKLRAPQRSPRLD
jgi:putative tryptophan/tyrosine transport system substrate-binding protein